MNRKMTYLVSGLVAALSVVSCGKSTSAKDVDEMLLQIGDSVLTKSDVLAQMPQGLSPTDSLNLFDAIVKEWTERLMLEEVARENLPNIDKINRIVEDYRHNLIILEYRKLMSYSNESQIPADTLKAYYEAHKKDFTLTQPLVKGLFVKLPESASDVADVKRWVFSASAKDVEELEKYSMSEIMQYDYFMDRWVDWSTIVEQIPYRFGDADKFVSSTKNFEARHEGSIYLWHIEEYMPSGEVMPYEYAVNQISEILVERDRRVYDAELIKSICRQAIKQKKMVVGSYDESKLMD